MRVLCLLASRHRQKRHAELFYHSHQSHTARQRKRRRRETARYLHPDDRRIKAEAKHRLKHRPLADKTRHRRKRRHAHTAHKEQHSRTRHTTDQTAQLIDILRMRRVKHRTRTEEQESLKQRVTDAVEQHRHDSRRRQEMPTMRLEQKPRTHRREDDTHILRTRKRKETLHIIFIQRKQDTTHRRKDTDQDKDKTPPHLTVAEEIKAHAEHTVRRRLQHNSRHQSRHIARRRRMRARKPDMKR